MFYLIIQERECKISFNNNDEMIPLVLDFFSFLFFFFIVSFYHTSLLQRILILITMKCISVYDTRKINLTSSRTESIYYLFGNA